jgi:trans-aconitate methyltransferase
VSHLFKSWTSALKLTLNVPPNCRFEISDAEEAWNYSQRFDYIHGRALIFCFKDPSFVVQNAFDCLNPGGVLELQDPQMPVGCIDDTMNNTKLQELSDLLCHSADKLGRSLLNSKNYGKYMEEAGFVDIVEKHFYRPMNTWPKGKKEKLIAMWTQQDLLDGLHGCPLWRL